MTSVFDTEVRRRREATPWARVDVEAFMRDVALNGGRGMHELGDEVTLTARYRHAVSTRLWWTLSWVGEDGERRTVESQDFGLLLWRAAEAEMQARANAEREGEHADR